MDSTVSATGMRRARSRERWEAREECTQSSAVVHWKGCSQTGTPGSRASSPGLANAPDSTCRSLTAERPLEGRPEGSLPPGCQSRTRLLGAQAGPGAPEVGTAERQAARVSSSVLGPSTLMRSRRGPARGPSRRPSSSSRTEAGSPRRSRAAVSQSCGDDAFPRSSRTVAPRENSRARTSSAMSLLSASAGSWLATSLNSVRARRSRRF